MRLAGALLLLALPARLPAQLTFTFSAGARYSTVLVHDQIVTPFAVRPALAPALSVTAAMPLDQPWNVSAVLDVSTGEVRREDQGGGTQPITHLTTAALGLGLSRALKPWLDGSLRIGVLKYLPSEDLGLFQDGGPFPLRPSGARRPPSLRGPPRAGTRASRGCAQVHHGRAAGGGLQ